MTIEFRSQELVMTFRQPGSDQTTEKTSEVRWCPLTGRTMRITARRPLLSSEKMRAPEELPPEVIDNADCDFCKDLDAVTPGLVGACCDGRRLCRGEAQLFPNLHPYGCHSAVITLTHAHHVPLARFRFEHVRDGLLLARDYVRHVVADDPGARYVNVTWNLLPSSGGSILHPHFQVNADPVAVNSLRDNLEGAAAYHARTGERFWPALVAAERRARVRFVADIGDTVWLIPYAPGAHLEVWGLVPARSAISALDDEDVTNLATGLFRIMGAYHRLGRNSMNMAIEADEGADEEPIVRLRTAIRSNYRAWYRSDQTHFDVVLEECATVITPEATAALVRPAFDAPDSLDPDRGIA